MRRLKYTFKKQKRIVLATVFYLLHFSTLITNIQKIQPSTLHLSLQKILLKPAYSFFMKLLNLFVYMLITLNFKYEYDSNTIQNTYATSSWRKQKLCKIKGEATHIQHEKFPRKYVLRMKSKHLELKTKYYVKNVTVNEHACTLNEIKSPLLINLPPLYNNKNYKRLTKQRTLFNSLQHLEDFCLFIVQGISYFTMLKQSDNVPCYNEIAGTDQSLTNIEDNTTSVCNVPCNLDNAIILNIETIDKQDTIDKDKTTQHAKTVHADTKNVAPTKTQEKQTANKDNTETSSKAQVEQPTEDDTSEQDEQKQESKIKTKESLELYQYYCLLQKLKEEYVFFKKYSVNLSFIRLVALRYEHPYLFSKNFNFYIPKLAGLYSIDTIRKYENIVIDLKQLEKDLCTANFKIRTLLKMP